MRPQVYNIDRAEGELGRVFLREAVQRFRPGLASQMAESFSSAMEYNTVGYVYDLVKGIGCQYSDYGIGIILASSFSSLKVYWPKTNSWCITSSSAVKKI